MRSNLVHLLASPRSIDSAETIGNPIPSCCEWRSCHHWHKRKFSNT
ncbi:hypothetical protein [Chamaesiphon sp. VAR_69_metabat_338]|nr:hypothetical protein [Chamaesiphon sp. VAR_69_metabat_338]